nr:hypothetical protein [Tanacetum cinerariifolium]
MDLFAFICHYDPTKVRIGEREPAKREVKLLELTEGRTVLLNPLVLTALEDSGDGVNKLFDDRDDAEQEHSVKRDDDVSEETIANDVSEVAIEKTKKSKRKRKTTGDASASTFPPKKLRDDYHDATSIIGGKSLPTIRSLILEGSSVSSRIVKPRDDGLANSVSGLNLRTYPPSKRYVISSHFEVNFFARSVVADTPVMTTSVTTTVAADASVIQMCLGAEVRMRAEHTLEQKDRLEDKCAEQTTLLSQKDAEIAHLRPISLKEIKAAEAIHLHNQLSIARDLKEINFALEGEKDASSEKVATLESMTTSKGTELASHTAQVAQLTSDLSGFQLSRDEMSSKVTFIESKRDRLADRSSSLESAFELFQERMEAMQDEQEAVLGNRVAELDAQLLEMDAHLDEEFYPRFLTTISGRRWILTHGLKLAGRQRGPWENFPILFPSSCPLTGLNGYVRYSREAFVTHGHYVLDMKPNDADPPAATFEKEELATSPK